MAAIIPLSAVPAQTLQTTIFGGLYTRLNVYQRRYGLFIDVLLEGTLIIGGVICHDRNLIVRSGYLGYTGDFIFIDTEGLSDPTYDGLGGRYQLVYLDPSEV